MEYLSESRLADGLETPVPEREVVEKSFYAYLLLTEARLEEVKILLSIEEDLNLLSQQEDLRTKLKAIIPAFKVYIGSEQNAKIIKNIPDMQILRSWTAKFPDIKLVCKYEQIQRALNRNKELKQNHITHSQEECALCEQLFNIPQPASESAQCNPFKKLNYILRLRRRKRHGIKNSEENTVKFNSMQEVTDREEALIALFNKTRESIQDPENLKYRTVPREVIDVVAGTIAHKRSLK